ncbi:heavy-metal-associated domain-containing protein [Nocardioides guangzhouensis]|uniref:Heavy-metal-associated domain-containing protein n=1 Tax=Nocardioides guangzhouensis TaxID=2497878 RepID=A0A4Q4Z6W4_9ACTN|nr:heavy metal-associated domain-containing protein [Nocardioides guangzhouensis]RYP82704.1 heavy-metal-associated domain-containing protein [Nocardioides guangzhouensis]
MTTTTTTETTADFRVAGMTCGHCVRAVTTEIGAIPGVEAVAVDLAAGRVQVTSTHPLDEADLAAAVHEAGYDLA